MLNGDQLLEVVQMEEGDDIGEPLNGNAQSNSAVICHSREIENKEVKIKTTLVILFYFENL